MISPLNCIPGAALDLLFGERNVEFLCFLENCCADFGFVFWCRCRGWLRPSPHPGISNCQSKAGQVSRRQNAAPITKTPRTFYGAHLPIRRSEHWRRTGALDPKIAENAQLLRRC